MLAKKQLEFTSDSLSDIADIESYIALENCVAAEKVASAILKTAQILKNFPEIGKKSRHSGNREISVKGLPYTIYYKITATKIFVKNIVHNARDF